MDIHLIENETDIIRLYKSVGAEFGLEVLGFTSAEAYLDYRVSDDFSPPRLAIISDVKMQGKSGYELMDEVRKTDPDQKFIITTATPWEGSSEKQYACAYLSKPLSLEKLEKVLHAISRCMQSEQPPENCDCPFLSDFDEFETPDWKCPHKSDKSK